MLYSLESLRSSRERGFTLIELLVVILIIGILAAVAIPMFMNQRQSAGIATLKSDLKNAGTLMEGTKTPMNLLPKGTKFSEGVSIATEPLPGNKAPNGDATTTDFSAWKPYDRFTLPEVTTVTDGSGPGGRNYRTYTVTASGIHTSGAYNIVRMGETLQPGDRVRYSVYFREDKDRCRRIGIEEKLYSNFNTIIASERHDVCTKAGVWTMYSGERIIRGDSVDTLVINAYGETESGDSMDITGFSLVKVSGTNAYTSTQQSFCIEGTHQVAPEDYWKYDSAKGGLLEGRCVVSG